MFMVNLRQAGNDGANTLERRKESSNKAVEREHKAKR